MFEWFVDVLPSIWCRFNPGFTRYRFVVDLNTWLCWFYLHSHDIFTIPLVQCPNTWWNICWLLFAGPGFYLTTTTVGAVLIFLPSSHKVLGLNPGSAEYSTFCVQPFFPPRLTQLSILYPNDKISISLYWAANLQWISTFFWEGGGEGGIRLLST